MFSCLFAGFSHQGYVRGVAQEGQEEEEGSPHSILLEEEAEKEARKVSRISLNKLARKGSLQLSILVFDHNQLTSHCV